MVIQSIPRIGGAVPAPCNETNAQSQKIAVKLAGPPSGGKGTVSKFLKQFHATHYSSSAALTEYAKRHGYRVLLKQMNEGDLIEFEHVKLVSSWHFRDFLTYPERRLGVFDGWGRVHQELECSLPVLNRHADVHIFFLEATDDCLIERSRNRRRTDDVAISKRIRIYRENFDSVYESACRYLPKAHIHIINTTEMTEDDVRRAVADVLNLS